MFRRFILIILPLLAILLASCTNPFTNSYSELHDTAVKQRVIVAETRSGYTLADIPTYSGSLLVAPDDPVLDRLVGLITGAKSQVRVEVYILTEKRIIQALCDAKKRGVDVQVILERNVFGSRGMNNKTEKELTNAGITVTYANNSLYKLTHAKFLIADGTYVISTGNFSHSTFTKNREYFFVGDDSKNHDALERIFTADAAGHMDIFTSTGLVISPWDARAKIETVLKQAQKSILVTNQSFGDPSIKNILLDAKKRGVDVEIVTEESGAVDDHHSDISAFIAAGIPVTNPKKLYIHAK